MPADKKFDLGDYVEVKDRIARFYELYGNGRLVTAEILLTREPDDKPRVMVKAFAYRNPDDLHPAVGHSWLELPGTTPYTKGSEIENAETSAWGRAIAALGILTDKSIASAQEVENKKRPNDPDPVSVDQETGEVFVATVEGKVTAGAAPADVQFRQTPTGLMFGFVVEAEGRKRLKVIATDGLAYALQAAGAETLKGVWVTVEGVIERIPWRKGDKDMPPYQQMSLSRITTPEYVLPQPKALPRGESSEKDDLPALAAEEAAELDALEVPWPDALPKVPS